MLLSPAASRPRSLLALALPLVCSSCFTMALWGFLPEDAGDPGEDGTSFVYDRETKWSVGSVLVRVLATPLSLALDCVTCPVQTVLFCGDDDECECRCSSKH